MKNCILCALAIGILALTAACGPRAQTANLDQKLEKGFNCVGTEPFWNIKVEKSGIVFHQMDEEPMTYPYQPPKKQANSQVYETSLGESKLKVVVTAGKCSDGMSEGEYPYTVQAERDGQTYNGCAYLMGQNPMKDQ